MEICEYVHNNGGKTRLNTNGHGNIINGQNIAKQLVGKMDGVNISLNAPDDDSYRAVCRPLFDDAFKAMLDFAKDCKEAGVNCWFSVVDCIGEIQLNKCRALADSIVIPLRVREFIDNNGK